MPPKKTGPRVSAFLITINTNSKDLKLEPELKAAWAQILNNLGQYIKHKIPDSGRWGVYAVNEKENAKIISIKSSSGVEVGPKTGSIHLHSSIQITHTSNLQLEKKGIKTFIDNTLKIPGSYVNVIGTDGKTAFQKFEDYALKGSSN